jgi:hypothetical protein
MLRIRWSTFTGFSGRLAADSLVGIDRITQLRARHTSIPCGKLIILFRTVSNS